MNLSRLKLQAWNISEIDFTGANSGVKFRGEGISDNYLYNFIYSVVFSPKGNLFAVGFRDFVLIYDMRGNLVTQLFNEGNTDSVAFSPDGTKIVSAGSKALHLWDLNGKTIGIFEGHKDKVNSVAFSPDGTKIVSGVV